MKRLLAALVLTLALLASSSAQWLRWPVAWGDNMVISLAFGMAPTHLGHMFWALDFKHHDHYYWNNWRQSENRVVLAPAGGVVVWRGYNGLYGNCVMIDHGNGFTSVLAHLKNVWVWTGQWVGPRWLVGTVGTSGVPFWNPHLHWELRISNTIWSVDPRPHLRDWNIWLGRRVGS